MCRDRRGPAAGTGDAIVDVTHVGFPADAADAIAVTTWRCGAKPPEGASWQGHISDPIGMLLACAAHRF